MLEGFSDWQTDKVGLSTRAEPLLCEFWGALGDYVRQYILHPAVRTHKEAWLGRGMFDWRDPRVGIPLLQSFFRPEIFADGDVRCSDAFNLGVILGLDRLLRANLKAAGAVTGGFYCRYLWNFWTLRAVVDEVALLASAAKNVDGPTGPIRLHENPNADDEADWLVLYNWLADEFLQESELHVRIMNLGISAAFAFDEALGEAMRPEDIRTVLDEHADELRGATELALSLCEQLEAEGGMWEAPERRYVALRAALGVPAIQSTGVSAIEASALARAWPKTLEVLDMLTDSVFHEHADPAPAAVDWAWLKQGVDEMRSDGVSNPGVHLLPNGQITTGSVDPEGMQVPLVLDNPEEEVLFCDRSLGFARIVKTTWKSLQEGEHFAIRGREADGDSVSSD